MRASAFFPLAEPARNAHPTPIACITAGNNVALTAKNDIRIVAAQDTEAHKTEHSDWTVGAGIGVSASSNGGAALGVTANAGVGVATQKSQASTQLNSHISAGN